MKFIDRLKNVGKRSAGDDDSNSVVCSEKVRQGNSGNVSANQ